MQFKILADFVVLIHFLWIIFLFLGALWGVRNRVARIVHFLGLFFAVLIQTFGWHCPLTHLEVWLRSRHDPGLAYAGSFIIHYMEKLVYLELSQSLVLVATGAVCALNILIYMNQKKRKQN